MRSATGELVRVGKGHYQLTDRGSLRSESSLTAARTAETAEPDPEGEEDETCR